jgi:hypothetical protein
LQTNNLIEAQFVSLFWKEDIMQRPIAFIAAAALAVTASAGLAQQPPIPVNPNDSPSNSQNGSQAGRPQRAVSQDEVRRTLQQAGFNNIEFLESAYVVRATDANGANVVMTITPEEIRAVEVSPKSSDTSTGQTATPGTQNSSAGVAGQSGNKNGPTASSSEPQANKQGPDRNEAVREQDSAKIPGKPGGKSGPAVTPPSEAPRQ